MVVSYKPRLFCLQWNISRHPRNRLGAYQRRSWCLLTYRNHLSLPGTEPRSLGRLVCRLVTILREQASYFFPQNRPCAYLSTVSRRRSWKCRCTSTHPSCPRLVAVVSRRSIVRAYLKFQVCTSTESLNWLNCSGQIHNAVYSLGLGSCATFLIWFQLHAANKPFMNIKQTAPPYSRHGPELRTRAAHVSQTSCNR